MHCDVDTSWEWNRTHVKKSSCWNYAVTWIPMPLIQTKFIFTLRLYCSHYLCWYCCCVIKLHWVVRPYLFNDKEMHSQTWDVHIKKWYAIWSQCLSLCLAVITNLSQVSSCLRAGVTKSICPTVQPCRFWCKTIRCKKSVKMCSLHREWSFLWLLEHINCSSSALALVPKKRRKKWMDLLL